MTTTHDAELERLVTTLLADAVGERATDVHLTPTVDALRLRYRVDGELRLVRAFAPALRDALTATLRRMAGVGAADVPAEGRLLVTPPDIVPQAWRLSTQPTVHGPNVVLRALPPDDVRISLDDLGMPADVRQAWCDALERPCGLLVVTGPTGSGKTTTLYGSLSHLAGPTRNVLTVESPVESELAWVVQTPVEDTDTWLHALRNARSQDPDVIMCGEVRNRDMARQLCEIAMTGRLALTAMHAADGVEALTRLLGLGLGAATINAAVRGVLTQRLLRRVCPSCRRTRAVRADERAWLDVAALSADHTGEGAGCEACQQTGYHGRVAVFHLLRTDEETRRMLVRVERGEASAETMRRAIEPTSSTLRHAALRAAVEGLVSLQDAHQATDVEAD